MDSNNFPAKYANHLREILIDGTGTTERTKQHLLEIINEINFALTIPNFYTKCVVPYHSEEFYITAITPKLYDFNDIRTWFKEWIDGVSVAPAVEIPYAHIPKDVKGIVITCLLSKKSSITVETTDEPEHKTVSCSAHFEEFVSGCRECMRNYVEYCWMKKHYCLDAICIGLVGEKINDLCCCSMPINYINPEVVQNDSQYVLVFYRTITEQ